MKTKTKYFVSLKKDDLLLTVRGNADIPVYNVEDSLCVEIRKNKDGILYAFLDRRNNQNGSSWFQIQILDGVDRLVKVVNMAFTPRKFYPDVAWNTEVDPQYKHYCLEDKVAAVFKDATFAPKYASAKFNWQANYQFSLYEGIWVD